MADKYSSYSAKEGSIPNRAAAGQGINVTIQNLQNEQERIQKKTFTNWMNSYLCQKCPPIKVEDLFEDVKDGMVLLSLLEVLSGEQLPMEKGFKLSRNHHIANIDRALQFLEKKNIKLVNIHATSIADGKPSIVLGLIWKIILFFQIEETFNAVPANTDGTPVKKTTLPRQNLLQWVDSILFQKYNLHIKDFGSSWNNGVAFNAMIHNVRPDLVDMDTVHKQQAKINLEHAFSTAESHLGIPRLLDPEDVDVEKPDEKSIMTYVAQFLKGYPDVGGATGVPGVDVETAEKEMKAYHSLINWLHGEAKEVLDASLEPVTNRESEFMDYFGFKTELERREPLYQKLREKVQSGRSLQITQVEWENLNARWQEVDKQMKLWLRKLDSFLPGKLGKLGHWLYAAEEILSKEESTSNIAKDMAVMYDKLTQQHKEFFKDLEEWSQFFGEIKRTGRYEGMMLHGPHFDHLSKRLESVAVSSVFRLNRLEYTHMKYTFLASVLGAETRFKQWTVKYGNHDFVESLLTDYVNCIDTQHMCENIDIILTETKKKAEKYKKEGADSSEVASIDNFLDEASGKWKNISLEIRSVRTTLGETSQAWTKYNTCVETLNLWLAEGERVMKQDLQAKEVFFKDHAAYDEKCKLLNESAHFLVVVCTEEIGKEVRQTVANINKRLSELFEAFHSFHEKKIIAKAREQYEKGVVNVESQLNDSTAILNKQIRCVHAELKDYLIELDKYSVVLHEAENNFTVTTKTAQSLVKDSSDEDVKDMVKTLNAQTGVLKKLKKEVPEKIKYLKAILPNVESLETGILDLQTWLTEGEKLITTHASDGSPDETEKQLQRYKVFLTKTTYQKSNLESKNNVFQKIIDTKDKLRNIDFTPIEKLMTSTNDRFQMVVSKAKELERKLENVARLRRLLQQKQQKLESWLDTAQNILDESQGDPVNLISRHKTFFDIIDHHLMLDYETSANEFLQQTNTSERKLLLETLGHLKERWEHVLHHAPIRLFKLEFVIPENKFEHFMEIAEVALQQQQDQIKENSNVKEALEKHKQMFHEGNLVPSCEQWLDDMRNLAQDLLKLSKDEQSLEQRHWNHLQRWNKLRVIANGIFMELKQLPERWKQYHDKLFNFTGWIENTEKLLENLHEEGLTSDKYKQLLNKTQREMQNMSKYQEDLKLLEQNLEDLIKDSPEADARQEKEYIRNIQTRMHILTSKMDSVQEKSSVLSKGYEYRDNADKMSLWLDEVYKLSLEHPHIDSLEDARAYLHEHDAFLNRLEEERRNILAELETGKHLQRDRNSPAFIQQSVADLERKWKDVNTLVQAKHEKLTKQVRDWESYESEKATLLTDVKKVESELEKPIETLSQENAQKDLQLKKELQMSVTKLRTNLKQLAELNEVLVEGTSQERQAPLKGEITDIDLRLENISRRADIKITDLEATLGKWSEYYKKLNHFCDWLNEKESMLNEVLENKLDSPENQLQKAEGIASQVSENHITLENLEKDARGLTQNFRSRMTAPLQSKLTIVRRQWQSLCTLAKDRSTVLLGNVAHWQKYQTFYDQLLPWVLKAEKYFATELPKCSSLEEAKDLYDLHQAFLQECDENRLVFDQLNTEASYMLDQPNVQRELEVFQRRWGSVLTNSDDRSQKVDRVFESWSTFENEYGNFQEVLNKISSRLSIKPNINTSDVQVLEHELALAKAIQEDVRSHEVHLNLVVKQFEQVQVHASLEGKKILKLKQDSIRNRWMEINNAVLQRQKVLAEALQHSKDFFNCCQTTEMLVKTMHRKLDLSSEIYSDELTDAGVKLKIMKDEWKSQEKIFHDLNEQLSKFVTKLNDDEVAVLNNRFDRLLPDYAQLEQLLSDRGRLCDTWYKFIEAQKDIRSKVTVCQAKLLSPDIKEHEVTQIIHDIENLRRSIQPWSQDAAVLDDLMLKAQVVIKDRATQRTLYFGSELKALEKLFNTVDTSAKQKEAQLEELTQVSSEFVQQKDSLVNSLIDVHEKLKATNTEKSSLQGIQDLIRNIEAIHDNLHLHNPEYEHLRELGRQIMASDPTKVAAVQQQLGQMSADWEAVQNVLVEKQQLYTGIANTWQQYNDCKQGIMTIIADLDQLTRQKLAFNHQDDARKSLEHHRSAELKLHANQTNLDHMNRKGLQLMEDLKAVKGFDMSGVESDLDDVNLKWENTNEVIEGHRKSLEAQIVCWDQVQSGMEEVDNWVKSVVSKLEDSLLHFDEVISVKSRLNKYKDEEPYYQEKMAEVNEKLKDLIELNRNKSVPSLASAQKSIKCQLETAAKIAGKLETTMSVVCEEQQNLQKAMSEEVEWMTKVKEALAKCDDITGTSEDLIERFDICKHLQQELAVHQNQISEVQNRSSLLQKKYPSSETSSLAKSVVDVNNKLKPIIQRVDRIQNSLQAQLEQQCADAQQQPLKWLNGAKEKLSWCEDIAGDRYIVEVKLAAAKDLEVSIPDEEQKIKEAANILAVSQKILPRAKQVELKTGQQNLEEGLQSLKKSIQQTQKKLKTSMNQWQEYDQQYDVLSQWLKDTDVQMRSESTLKPDLDGKRKQLKTLKALYQSVQSHDDKLEAMQDLAQQISHVSGDNHTVSSADQLVSRYQTLLTMLRDQVKTCEQNVYDHEQYVSKWNLALEWLKEAMKDLDQCSSLPGDTDALTTKLSDVKDLQTHAEDGSALVSAALEAGEKLYPNTSNEGRENIRHEMCSLRDSWETFSDGLSDVQRQLDSSRMQWMSFDENFEQLNKWLVNVETHMIDPEMKTSLPEKKTMLHYFKTQYQDMLSHQPMIDGINEKGTALSSSQIQNKLKQLNKKYSHLCKTAEMHVKKVEDYISEHQQYQDICQQCKDWMDANRDKVSVCAQFGGDKHVLQNRLGRLQEVMGNLPEGESKIKMAVQLGERTMAHTSSQGKANIKNELHSIRSDYDTLVAGMTEAHQHLQEAIKAVEMYVGLHEALNSWLQKTESKLKDCEMKDTLQEKEAQIIIFKKVEQEICSKQTQFNELQGMATKVHSSDTRLANQSAQLATKYETLKQLARDVIAKWEDYKEENRAFIDNYNHCVEWIKTLRSRSKICEEPADDKQEVEARLIKLQELFAEKNEGGNHINQTIESGERLFSSTSSLGRDIIREDIRKLRVEWEALSDDVTKIQRRLELNLSQWVTFDKNSNNFKRWLFDMEALLMKDAYLQATLPEKKAQFQNHKVLHQDILSRDHIIDNLEKKAHALTETSPSRKVMKLVGELKNKYDKVCQISKDMLDKLEHSVYDHQQYQDAAQDFTDWLTAARIRLEACSDRSGNKVSLQEKKEQLKQFAVSVKNGDAKLMLAKNLAATTAKNTLPHGQEVMQRELTHLQTEWDDFLNLLAYTESSLDQTLNMWQDFESTFEQLTVWLNDIEPQTKDHELKGTAMEKEEQLNKFKKLHEEIVTYQMQIDRFIDDAQNLMHASCDVRLATQVSQLSNKYQRLLSHVKDLITKWDGLVQEHQLYNCRMQDFQGWISTANQRLQQCMQSVQVHISLQEKKSIIQILLSESDHGHKKLCSSLESGEKLYADTSAVGKETIRKELQLAKQSWETVHSDLNDAQRHIDLCQQQWSSYSDGRDQFMRWLTETEAAVFADVDLKSTLQEKRHQLQTHLNIFQEITSHQGVLDSVILKAEGVLQISGSPEVSEFITTISSQYEKLRTHAKNLMQRSEQHVNMHQQYQDSFQAALDWMVLLKDKQTPCADITGDRNSIQNKLDTLTALVASMPEGTQKLEKCENLAQITMENSGLKGRLSIQSQLDVLHSDWEDCITKMHSLKESLEQAVHHWTVHESSHQKLSTWLISVEKQIIESPLKSTLKEKQEQLSKYTDLLQEIQGYQREFDTFTDESNTLLHLTSEPQVGSAISQLTVRYQALLTSGKELKKQCERNVEDHKLFSTRFTDSSQWLVKTRKKFSECSLVGSSRTEIENKLDSIQDIEQERDVGFAKLNQCVEAGERLYPNTAPDGRHTIRQDLCKLKLDYEAIFDDLSTVQRDLEVSLVEWTSFDESCGQVEHWLRQMQSQFEDQIPLRASLEEKKLQHHTYKALQQDVLSYQKVVTNISDKANTLVRTSKDPVLVKFISKTDSSYSELCDVAKEHVYQYECFVKEHQQLSDLYNSCTSWFNSLQEKLSICSSFSGDQNALQNRLDQIQDILSTKMEDECRVKEFMELSEQVLSHTAAKGKPAIVRDRDALNAQWKAFNLALTKTKDDLETCMELRNRFEVCHDQCASWLKDVESYLRETEMKATLQEKKAHLDKLKILQTEVLNHQKDLDSLSDAAKNLIKRSSDSYITSQASQLIAKHQATSMSVKELCRRWEQIVLEHHTYVQAFNKCQSWLAQMKEKVTHVSDTSGDKSAIKDKLDQVQELLHEKEEGIHMLQIALDKIQSVLPNTSVAGRETMRHDIQILQQEYDSLSATLNNIREHHDSMFSQWTAYDDSLLQLQRWLKDLEDQLTADSVLQNTLQEKQLQMDRVKLLQLNISSQQSIVDNLNEKAEYLKRASKHGSLDVQISQVVDQYNKLVEKVKDLIEDCEKNLLDHQIYRNAYLSTSDWLGSAVEKLGMCSDIRGDRYTTEAQLHKVKDITLTLEVGQQQLQETLQKGSIVLDETSHQGQNLIKEELRLLTCDFNDFESDLRDSAVSLATLKDKWARFEELYEELNHWIKDTENNVKTNSDLKASLDRKEDQLSSHRTMHQGIFEQQESFNLLGKQAEDLMQLSTDRRIPTQLNQLMSRYSALITLSKDMMKKYEQTVEDHEHYSNTYRKFWSWLQTTKETFCVHTSSCGDRHVVQSQLESLKEFDVHKGEGQICLHAALTWGEKTMMHTSVEGREIIRRELDQLQEAWDLMISQVTDTKVMLESNLLEWSDYDASYEHILKWLKVMEKHLRDTQLKSDLSEKKAEIQHVKTLCQDIVSYEQMVESVAAKAADLAEKNPASHATVDASEIQSRYVNVKEQAKDLLARTEQIVAHHQNFHDSCHSFSSWLQTAVEKLTICSETYGEKSAVLDKIERSKSLITNMSEGTKRLSLATKAGEMALATTSASGQTKIRQELQTMNKNFEVFRLQLTKVLSDLELCLTRWDEFDDSYLHFGNWLRETEMLLRAELKYMATLEEKKDIWEEYQLHRENVASHKSTLDRVCEKAHALLEINADVNTSHAMTQLTIRYNGIVALGKDITSNLEMYYNNHKLYTQNQGLFNDWLKEMQRRLQAVSNNKGSKEILIDRIKQIEVIQDSLDGGHTILHMVLESCEKTLSSTNKKGSVVIKNQTDLAKTRYESILTEVSQAKRSLEGALVHWEDFEHLCQLISVWMMNVEQKLATNPDFKSDLAEKKSNLEKYKALHADIQAHKCQLDKLEEKADQVRDSLAISKTAELKSQYALLLKTSKDGMENAEQQVGSHEEYRRSFIECQDWLTNTKHCLRLIEDYSGDRNILQYRLSRLGDVKADLGRGQELLTQMMSLGEKLCQTTSPFGQNIVQKEMDNLLEEWKLFSSTLGDVERNLESAIANFAQLDNEQHEFNSWLERMDKQLKLCQQPKTNLAEKKVQLQHAENLCDIIINHKTELNKIKDKGDEIIKKSSDVRVSNNVMQLFTRYQALCTSSKNTASELKESVQDHTHYDEALNDATTWLAMTMQKVQTCNNSSGNCHTIEERIANIKDVTISLDDGLQKVNYVCDQAEKILPLTSLEGKKLIEEQVIQLTDTWEKLNSEISGCTEQLEDLQQKWLDYNQYYRFVTEWLADTENYVQLTPGPCASLSECKTQRDRFQMVASDIESHDKCVKELSEKVSHLHTLCHDPDIVDSLKNIKDRYSSVASRVKEVGQRLQNVYDEHQSFFEAQQNCERWLANMSNRLTASNKLNTSTMELTLEQIETHNLILREIEDYHLTLDSLSHLGQELILSNSHQPQLAAHIQSQATRLEESYLNIQSTALQIRDHLLEVLNKWQNYKSHLDTADKYLTNDFPQWMAEADKNIPDTQAQAHKQREMTQAELEKLYSMKQGLQNALQQCLDTDSSEQLDLMEGNVKSSVAVFAGLVNSKLTASINQAEEHLDQLREMIKKWDSVDSMRQELRLWLHEKQEELSVMENKSSKFHQKTAELAMEQLQAFHDEIRARASAVEVLQNCYKSLTQHNPSLMDPVVKAIQDDWEELLGQTDILIHDREVARTRVRDIQAHNDSMDEYLNYYAHELEILDRTDNKVLNKSRQMQRRRCRSTQTHSVGTGSDSDHDGPPPWKSARGSKGQRDGARGTAGVNGTESPQLHGSPGTLGRSSSTSRSNLRHFLRPNDSQDSRSLKKSFGANATMESESEESGYGDTYGDTLNALSDDHSFFIESEQHHMPMTDIESDDESTGSFISGEFLSVDSVNLIHIGTQTPGHVQTQTQELKDSYQTSMAQTEIAARAVGMQTSTTSLHSIGAETKKSNGSRMSLLRGLLSEVKVIKKQHNINTSRDETMSITSDMSVNRDVLDSLYRDLANLRAAGAKGDAATQTLNDQSTQTSTRLYPEGDFQKQVTDRQIRMNDMLEEIWRFKTENHSIEPSHAQSKLPDFGLRTPIRSLNRAPSARGYFPPSVVHRPSSTARSTLEPDVNSHTPESLLGMNDNYPRVSTAWRAGASRQVTLDDLNNVNERLDRLQNYRMSNQQHSLPTYQPSNMAQPSQTHIRASLLPTTPHQHYHVREFRRSYDDIDIPSDGRRSSRVEQTFRDGVMNRYHLDDALLEATRAARQLKRMSAKIKLRLREELRRSQY